MIIVGNRIKQLRKERGLSLRKLRNLSNVSLGTLSDIENGLSSPRMDTLQKIASAFDVTLSYLTGENQTIINNIKLIMGDLTPAEFVNDIAKTIGNNKLEEKRIVSFLNGKVTPMVGSLFIMAEYAGIDFEFFYKDNNTLDSLELEKERFKKSKEISNDELYKQIYEKIKANELDPKAVNSLIDALIAQKKTNQLKVG